MPPTVRPPTPVCVIVPAEAVALRSPETDVAVALLKSTAPPEVSDRPPVMATASMVMLLPAEVVTARLPVRTVPVPIATLLLEVTDAWPLPATFSVPKVLAALSSVMLLLPVTANVAAPETVTFPLSMMPPWRLEALRVVALTLPRFRVVVSATATVPVAVPVGLATLTVP